MENKQDSQSCGMYELLVSYLYNETSAEEASCIEAHIHECAQCREELAGFERVRSMLQQWQIDDVPLMQIRTRDSAGKRKAALTLLKELFLVMPIWVRSLGVTAAALFVLAALGTEVTIGRSGVDLRFDIVRSTHSRIEDRDARLGREDVRIIVDELVAQNVRLQRAEIEEQLIKLEAALQDARSSDLARLYGQIREQRARLATLERDLDRREGLDLTEILLNGSGRSDTGNGAESGQ